METVFGWGKGGEKMESTMICTMIWGDFINNIGIYSVYIMEISWVYNKDMGI